MLPSFPNFGGIGHTGAIPSRFLYPTAHPFALPHGSNYPVVPGTMLNPPPGHGAPAHVLQPSPPLQPLSMHHQQQNDHPTASDNSDQLRLDAAREHENSKAVEQHQDEHAQYYDQGSKNESGQLGDHNVHWTRYIQQQHRDLETGQISPDDTSDEEEELVVDDVKSPDCEGHEDNISLYPSGTEAHTQTDHVNHNCTKVSTRESKTSSCTPSATHPSVITWHPQNVSGPPPLIKRVGENPDAAFVSKYIEEARPQREWISQQVAEGVLAEKRKAFSIQNSKNGRVYTGREEWYSPEAVHQLKGKRNALKSPLNVTHSAVNVRTAAAIVCP